MTTLRWISKYIAEIKSW